MIGAAYFHGIDGRMRIHVVEAKGSRAKAREIADRPGSCFGIDNVSANPVTGNVLITYDSNRISQWDILAGLRDMGRLDKQECIPQNQGTMTANNSQWSATIVRVGLEALLSALVL